MDKTLFLQILQHYASTSVEEAKEIFSLKAQFPYSQVLQTLTARVSRDHGFEHQQHDLQIAAVYAADRGLLKEIITLQPKESLQQAVPRHLDATGQVNATLEAADVADVIMDDLEQLSKLKNTFENLYMDPNSAKGDAKFLRHPESKENNSPVKEEIPAKTNDHPVQSAEASAKSQESPVKSKKERIIELAKAVEKTSSTDGSAASKKKHLDKDGNPVDELIAEIQSSKEEIVPDSETQKQQIEIINQFIRIQPSISNPKDKAISATGDLTPVKSGEFGDNIVSETLAEILIKQGKKDKAIEVLKKLIWKYPQKKAYFASQIEDLKK